MTTCEHCGESASLAYICRYCDCVVCRDHRLPENHACSHLGGATTLGPEFRHVNPTAGASGPTVQLETDEAAISNVSEARSRGLLARLVDAASLIVFVPVYLAIRFWPVTALALLAAIYVCL